jgi:hypothetical protein
MGDSRQQEVRLTGLALAAIATAIAVVAFWGVMTVSERFHSQVSDSVPQPSINR